MPSRRSVRPRRPSTEPPATVRHGVARAISRAGLCSRRAAADLVAAGRVRIDGRTIIDPEHPTTAASRIEVDGVPLVALQRVYVALNKPRGLLTTRADEHGRDTVYACLEGSGLPWLAPVGRLDKASEGLLLLSNDPAWAAAVTEPALGLQKTYDVQVATLVDDALLQRIAAGVDDAGERLAVVSVQRLRHGERNAWLRIVLDEGRNRQIRRLLAALGIEVRRLVRIAIGPLALGDLGKGQWRHLDADEVAALAPQARQR